VAVTDISRVLFHQTLNGLEWVFVMEPKNTTKSETLLASLKLGVLENVTEDWIQSMKQCVRTTAVEGEFTCRAWALAALYDMADYGFIGLMPD
jgi:hypothetical protein